jgi:hypothetical protein
MHFRERDQIVQIIRTKYDAELKRGKNEIIGRMAKANPKITDELDRKLRQGRAAQKRAGGAYLAGTVDVG